jgi:hypothetical protein
MTFNNPLRLGWAVNPDNYRFKGLLDEVSLYDRALSVDEIQAIFNAGSLGKAKYQFNIATTSLPTLFVGSSASSQLDTVFGTVPVNFILASGDLPPGMTLNASGVVIGTPTAEGNFSFTVQATDALSLTATRTITASVLTTLSPPSDLAHWWPGDGNTTDIVGGSNGTFQNGTGYTPNGKVAGAFVFDGTNNYISIPSINLGTTFSLEFWAHPMRTGVREHLVSNSYSSSNFGSFSFVTDHVEFQQGGSTKVSSPSGSVPVNTWSHVALTYDGTVSQIFVNGILVGTSASYAMTFNNALRFGFSVNGSDYHFIGLIDEVSLYSRVLSGDEILSIFNAGSGGKRKP